jgi:hypothetical protein
LETNGQSGRDEILAAMKKGSYSFSEVENSTTIWLDYYQNKTLHMDVSCGFQFNEDMSLYVLGFYVNAPW